MSASRSPAVRAPQQQAKPKPPVEDDRARDAEHTARGLRTLDLREVIRYYVLHQKEVVTRRTKDELQRAERRAHILEGLLIALSNIDAVIRRRLDADELIQRVVRHESVDAAAFVPM